MARVRAKSQQGATFVELFFDLVFVYAVTQLTATVLHDLSWEGVGRAALVFWLVWWAWTQFTWTLNLADTEHTWIRLPTLAATAVAFFMAQAVPDAFGSAGGWFAVSYVLVRLIGLAVQTWVVSEGGTSLVDVARFASGSFLGLGLVVLGGFLDADMRHWFWLGAVLADLGTVAVAGRGSWELEAGHFAERHGLIVIIALGESLIAAGVATSEVDRDLVFAFTTIGAVVAACALWWVYFGTLHVRYEHALASVEGPSLGRFARDVFSLSHAVVVAGVIGIAVGFEDAVAHPDDNLGTGAALALTVGVALFVGGLAGAAYRAGLRGAAGPRALLAVVALSATPLVTEVPAAVALWGLAVLTVAMSVLESVRHREPEVVNGAV